MSFYLSYLTAVYDKLGQSSDLELGVGTFVVLLGRDGLTVLAALDAAAVLAGRAVYVALAARAARAAAAAAASAPLRRLLLGLGVLAVLDSLAVTAARAAAVLAGGPLPPLLAALLLFAVFGVSGGSRFTPFSASGVLGAASRSGFSSACFLSFRLGAMSRAPEKDTATHTDSSQRLQTNTDKHRQT